MVKRLNDIKMIKSFGQLSDVLDAVSMVIRIITVVLVIAQGILLIKNAKESIEG